MLESLTAGQTAPQFKVQDVFGNPVNLSDFANKYTLVVFLRYAGCPWCNLALHRLVLEQKLLKNSRCQIIAFIQSEKENILTNIYDRHKPKPEFPIIADPEGKYYELYKVKSSKKALVRSIKKLPYWLYSVKELGFKQSKIDGNWLTVPASFMISEGGQTILKATYSADFYDNETFTDIYQKLIFDRADETTLQQA